MATIIKLNDAEPESEPVIYVFDDIARRRVNQAQQEAATILELARRRADELCHDAERTGRASAAQSAEQDLERRVSERVSTLEPALSEVAAQLADVRQEWLRRWEKTAISLAVKIAERIVRQEIKKKPKITLNLVREALEMAAGTERIKIFLHPDDCQALGADAERLAAEIARAAPTEIVPDKKIARGGCRVDTPHGSIDQQIETRLARIAEELSADA